MQKCLLNFDPLRNGAINHMTASSACIGKGIASEQTKSIELSAVGNEQKQLYVINEITRDGSRGLVDNVRLVATFGNESEAL